MLTRIMNASGGGPGLRALLALAAIAGALCAPAAAQDCDNDGIPNSTELGSQQTIFNQTFESGPAGWTLTGLWRIETGDGCGAGAPTLTPPSRAVYNRADTCTFNTGGINSGSLTSPVINLNPTWQSITLKYYDHSIVEGEDPNFDFQRVQVSLNGGAFQNVRVDQSTGAAPTVRPWGERTIDLTAFKGGNIRLRFNFDTGDGNFNDFRGWYVDDVRIQKISSDCNANSIPDECENFTPVVLSSNRVNPALTAAATLPFAVTFADLVNVSGPAAFQVVRTGSVASTGLTVTGSGTSRNVSVTGVTGDGTVRLDVLAGSGVSSVCYGLPLPAAFTSGQSYTVDQTAPNPGTVTAAVPLSCSDLRVDYTGAADVVAGGVSSGLAVVQLYYRRDAGPWTFSGMTSPAGAGSFVFTAPQIDGLYSFKLRAVDQLGNTSAVPTGTGDVSARIDTSEPIIVDCPSDFTTTCNTDEGYNLSYAPTIIDNCPFGLSYEINPRNPIPYGTTEVFVTARDASGNSSSCSFSVTVVPDQQDPLRLFSLPAGDGFVREPDYINGIEGQVNTKSQALSVGDDVENWGYRAVLSFPTESIPPDAIVTAARIRLTRSQGYGNPSDLGPLRLDLGNPSIGVASIIDPLDYEFDAAPIRDVASSFPTPPGNEFTTFAEIMPEFLHYITESGPLQFRVRFDSESDEDRVRDLISFYSGEAGISVRPELIVEYYKPSCFEFPEPPTPAAGPFTLVAYATPANDGRVTEYHWTSGVGGVADATSTTTPVGDTSSRQQHQLMLSFDTSSIPADATILSAELQLFLTSRIGTPSSLGPLVVDMRNPWIDATSYRYGSSDTVQPEDFQIYSPFQAVATLTLPSLTNQYTAALLNPTGLMAINKGGTTQMKVHYTLEDNGNALSDTASFATGNFGANSPARPRLTITYMTP